MDYRWNPRVFLVAGIGNFALTGISFVILIVLFSLGSWRESTILIFTTIIFPQIGGLAVWQYQHMRVIEEKFKNLEQGLSEKQVLLAK
jgi:ABC-type uncharacterized transport system permease subunit